MIIERLVGPIPAWASRENPMLNYQLRTAEAVTRRGRLLRALGVSIFVVLLVLGGYAVATDFFSIPLGQNWTDRAVSVLFYPLVIVQTGIAVAALALTIGTIGEEQRHLTWDNLRATPVGAAMTLRTRWAAVFYRLLAPLVLVTVLRLGLVFRVLTDLTAFQGRYLDLLIGGITPDIPATVGPIPFAVPVAALLLSLFLTSVLLIPFTTIAFDAAVGLFLSTIFQQRVYSLIVQFVLFMLRVGAVGGLIWLGMQYLEGGFLLNSVQAWFTMLGFSVIGDWGVQLLHLEFAGTMWENIPYGVFIGPLLLVFVLLQAFATSFVLRLAVRIAEHRG